MNTALETVKQTRVLHWVFLVTIAFYFYAGEIVGRREVEPATLKIVRLAFLAIAAYNIFLSTSFRKKLLSPAQEVLRQTPDDGEALKRWQTGNMLTFCFCEVVALLGFALRFLGGTILEAALFYVTAAGLLIAWAPRAGFARPE
ncbi:MAG: hypothetical protein M1453_15430 [Acidobacteria bacterium]|nr:hypothetical protein [Acidobacteriota bacterium]MCL5289373.1 hypothetical protein [Acidobacteriota bacterium]